MISLEKLVSSYRSAAQRLTHYGEPLALLLVRLLVARVFLMSGLTKWSGPFQFNTDKYDLFLYEFFCPDPPRAGALQLCSPDTLDYAQGSSVVSLIEAMAVTTGVLEILLSVMLILGLFSRFSAFALLSMTLFIQLAVFPTWDHWWNPAAWWAMSLLVVLASGPGKWSLDRLLGMEKTRIGNMK